ncbi:hypothetical protein G7070_11525 [Propioniciclava coleopterorum]|uniref:Glycoside hydrolase 35 catalytic domain-containing protein n=1 Tax=Propioniciclava coleopterorum TaxID=2714937 RepID=A0A6G7Y7Y0_9ACTN|nr:beta-galactosidase [Propioniciclava coleopterorum]QIK72786.1 hypothetical protein G7070_11525 [Propioniciclava coleopterorum]
MPAPSKPSPPPASTPPPPSSAPLAALSVPRPAPPRRDHLPLGEPPGAPDRIAVTATHLERGGRPWFPVSGEVHYARLPRHRWDEVLAHARAGGLNAVACYVFWQAHEPEPGRFRWEGNLDLRAFVERAAAHGLDVVVRLGPWAHGEARLGGFPDWLGAADVVTRTDDPGYLRLVRRLYGEIAAQLTGLNHAEGGPVVGVQVDNELYDQPGHLATLRALAEDAGLRVPLWTATGWGGAQVPDTLLPVFGGYADGFWEEADTDWPDWAAVHFRPSAVRDDLGVGADVRAALGDGPAGRDGVRLQKADAVPFATCELGGGMHVAYHRRPLVTPEDVAALTLAKIASGSAWQGYYMYAGGTQRVGPHGTEQESQATGYPNDVPTRSYDFHAPIGEFGQLRPHFHLLRRQHLFLAADPDLAAMPATIGPDEGADLRWSVRSDGRRGHLFWTTHQPARHALPGVPVAQVQVAFDDAVIAVPSRPLHLPAGVAVAWPLRLPLAPGVTLRSATAQLLARVSDAEGDLVVLGATDGVPVEVVLEGDVPVQGAASRPADGATVVEPEPGPACLLGLPGVRVLVLDQASADRLWLLPLAGAPTLLLADAALSVRDGALVVRTEAPTTRLSVWGGRRLQGPGLRAATGPAGWWSGELATAAGTRRLAADLAPDARAPLPRVGGPAARLSAPTDASGAARVPVAVPDVAPGADRVLLRVRWSGDVGRALLGEEVLSDHFWHGRVWDVDLSDHLDAARRDGLTLELLPWRAATGVWVDPSVRGVPDGVRVAAIDLVTVTRTELRVAP